ncbi:MAG: MscL family protein [Candidatus Pacearchaeota archaeon]|jgi:large conductance mechanosensitive channel
MRERIKVVKERVKTHSSKEGATMRYFSKDFRDFLKEYRIITLAIAIILGGAGNQLIKSLVDNVIMPMIIPVLPSAKWEDAVFTFGSVSIRWGEFLSDIIYFLIIALFVYFLLKLIIREEKK